ncbi:MAG: efflux transporter outer membrane subunit [Methyloversatilis sp.]|jgi:NodT family efflux transporter outer membrane factor (OMF) lipoprotein|nr:efflux transporter outer membrane subunit [Methyloversatilis sp.]MBP6195422.1 efflux transporter outer membrane subunit [Methyloversatilis sp.]MBP9118438.1 efflux transporter outer membrane subunit [Methyloversatilis sp.]
MNRTFPLLFPLVLALLAAGCTTMGPDHERPALDMPSDYRAAEGWKPAEPADHLPRGEWWRTYGDPVLDELINRVDRANPDLQSALGSYRQARAAARQARAGYQPEIGLSAAARRSRGAAIEGRSANQSNTTQLGLDASWEADLWGRIGREVEAAGAELAGTAADLASVRLSLHAELVQNYFQLRATDSQRDLYRRSVESFARALELARNRVVAGVATRSDEMQALAQLRAAQAQAVDLDLTRAQLQNAIAVLIGTPPSAFSLESADWPATPPATPVGLPSTLLERRPDIAAAERRVAAANARIGVAQAAWFPSLTLNASTGYAGNQLAQWFSASNLVWSFGLGVAQAVYDGGRRDAQIESARAAHDITVAQYRQTVLGALQEVEDNLSALRLLEEEAVLRVQALAASREAEALALNRYRAGIASYTEVITAQTTALDNERGLAQLRGRQFSASALLNKAIGGGWGGPAVTP